MPVHLVFAMRKGIGKLRWGLWDTIGWERQMPDADGWREMIGQTAKSLVATVTAQTFSRYLGTASGPAEFICSDGNVYIVKSKRNISGPNESVLVNEHVMAWLGREISAPIPEIRIVDIPQDVISNQPQISHMAPGLSHGSLSVAPCTDSRVVDHLDVPGNRERFALLAIFYGWLEAGDHQFLYADTDPKLVYSADHGHFIFGGGARTASRLSNVAARAAPDVFFSSCSFTAEELRAAGTGLHHVSDSMIAQVVASPPAEWNFGLDDRVAFAIYLARRRDELLDDIVRA